MLNNSCKKSVTGGYFVKPDPNRTIKMKYKDYARHVKAVAAAVAVATTVAIGSGSFVADKIRDEHVINKLTNDFWTVCINKETHLTDDREHFYYDYDHIAQFITDTDDDEMGIYLLNRNTDDYQTNKVLHYMPYDSLEGFLKEKNYADMDDFRKSVRERLIIEDKIHSMLDEIDEINNRHSASSIEGGQK